MLEARLVSGQHGVPGAWHTGGSGSSYREDSRESDYGFREGVEDRPNLQNVGRRVGPGRNRCARGQDFETANANQFGWRVAVRK